jgi:hypothetical protein
MSNNKHKSKKIHNNTSNKKILDKLHKLAKETKLINNGKINIYDVMYQFDDDINHFENNVQLGGSKLYLQKNSFMTLQEAMFDSFRRQYNLKN